MIPLTFLYNEYIDRLKLSEQKLIWVYSFFPHKWSRNKNELKPEIIIIMFISSEANHRL